MHHGHRLRSPAIRATNRIQQLLDAIGLVIHGGTVAFLKSRGVLAFRNHGVLTSHWAIRHHLGPVSPADDFSSLVGRRLLVRRSFEDLFRHKLLEAPRRFSQFSQNSVTLVSNFWRSQETSCLPIGIYLSYQKILTCVCVCENRACQMHVWNV